MQNCRLFITASGRVRSTATSAFDPTISSMESAEPSDATSSRSSAASTARQASLPIRPDAPSTATLIVTALIVA